MKKTLAIIFVLITVILFTCSCGAKNDNLSGSVFTEDGTGKYLTGCYLKVDGIEGESSDSQHAKWIDVIDFDFGVEHDKDAYVAAGSPLVIVHKVDSASPKLQKYCAAKHSIDTVSFEKTVSIAGKEKVMLKITLSRANIASAQITVDANGNIVETVKFYYNSATIEYTPIKGDGSVGTTVTETITVQS